MKLLIAYDGSKCADAAIFDLKRAGLPAKVEAVVFTAADIWSFGSYTAANYPEAWVQQTQMMVETAKDLAREFSEKGRAAVQYYFPDWRVAAECPSESPVAALLAKASKWHPDLIVLGSHGHSGIAGILFGSVSQQVLSSAPFNVRIARGSFEENVSTPRLIVGVDGSLASGYAVEEVANRSWPKGTAVRLVTAADARLRAAWLSPDAGIGQWVEQEDTEPMDWVHRVIGACKIRLEAAGLVVSSVIRKDEEPQRALTAEAAEWGADTVFLGSRGLNAGDQRLGKVAAAVAARARCAVEVVRVQPAWAAQAVEGVRVKAKERLEV